MTHIAAKLDVVGWKQLRADLLEASKGLKDYRKAWRRLVPFVALEIRTLIVTQGRSAGIHWPALKQATLRRRRRGRGSDRAALQMTGKLIRNVGTRRAKKTLSRKGVSFSARQRYEFVQHFGSKRRGIPARPFLVLTPRSVQHAQKLVLEQVDDVLGKFARGGR